MTNNQPASRDSVSNLHKLLTDFLVKTLEDPTVERAEKIKVSDIIRKFLADNNITATAAANPDLLKLRSALPFSEDEDAA